MNIEKAELTRIPTTTVEIKNPETAQKLIKLLDALEDSDDVQKVYSNFEMSEDMMKQLA